MKVLVLVERDNGHVHQVLAPAEQKEACLSLMRSEEGMLRLSERIGPVTLGKFNPVSGVTRVLFVCVHCGGVYADAPVSQCDCLAGTGADFVETSCTYELPVTDPKAEEADE